MPYRVLLPALLLVLALPRLPAVWADDEPAPVPVAPAEPDAVAEPDPVTEPDPATDGQPSPSWGTEAFLTKHLGKACDAVEVACGAKYPVRPTVRITSVDEMEEILFTELGPMFRNLGTTSDLMIRATCKALASALTAKYEPKTKIVHVLPDNIVTLAKATGLSEAVDEGLIRVLLAHEATHALDFQRFPALERERMTRTTSDGVQAVGAMLEGHAQLIAERVANTWEMRKAFQGFTALVFSQVPVDDPALKIMIDIQMSEHRFAYGQGHRFMSAVEAARGREGVEQALAAPPPSVRVVERPETWLDPSAARDAIDPDAIFAVVKPLFQNGSFQKVRLKRSVLSGIFAGLTAGDREPVLSKYDDGWIAVGVSADSGGQLAFGVIIFDDAEAAAGYAGMLEALSKQRDELLKPGSGSAAEIVKAEYDDRIGAERDVPALYMDKTVRVPAQDVTVNSIVAAAHQGRVALEFSFINSSLERPVIERAVLSSLAVLRGESIEPPPEAPTVPLQTGADVDALKALVASFREAATAAGDDQVMGLLNGILMTRAELRSVLRAGEAADAYAESYSGPIVEEAAKQEPAAVLEMAKRIFAPGGDKRTEILVWRATTEEIAAHAEGSVAFAEFPGGMTRFASELAAPERVWYVIEFVEPGTSSGKKLTCFTKLGDRFVAFFKPWRFLK